jgi:hypothetical protein
VAKRGTLEHVKTRRLARLLRMANPACGDFAMPLALGLLEALWHYTAREAPRGDIGRKTDVDIAEGVWYEGDASVLIGMLRESGWLVDDQQHRLLVAGWSEHADDAVRKMLARNGQEFADGGQTRRDARRQPSPGTSEPAMAAANHVAPCRDISEHGAKSPDVSRLPEPEPEPKPEPINQTTSTHAQPAAPGALGIGGFAAWWSKFEAAYPPRSGALEKPKAREKLQKAWSRCTDAVARDALFAAILDGAQRLRAWADAERKTGSSIVPQMTTWVNGRRWEETLTVSPTAAGGSAPAAGPDPNRKKPVAGVDYANVFDRETDAMRRVAIGPDGRATGELFDLDRWCDSRGIPRASSVAAELAAKRPQQEQQTA